MGRMWQWGLVWLWAGWAQARLPGWAPCWSSLLEPLGLGSPEETALPSRLCPSDPPAPLGSPEVSPCPLLPCTGLRWVWVWAWGGRGWPDHRARCTASGPGAGWLQGCCGRQAGGARCSAQRGPAGWPAGGGARGPDLLPVPRRLLLLGGRAGRQRGGHRGGAGARGGSWSVNNRTNKGRNFRSPAMPHLGEWLAGWLVHSRNIQSSDSHTIRGALVHSLNKL